MKLTCTIIYGYIFWICLITELSHTKLSGPTSSNEETTLNQCVTNLVNQIVDKDSTIISNYCLNSNAKAQMMFSINNENNNLLLNLKFKTAHVFNIENNTSLEDFKNLITENNFNIRAVYIIIINSHTTPEETFKSMAKLSIANLFIIDNSLNIFTYKPYIHENINKPDITPLNLFNCKNADRENFRLIEKESYPNKWSNSTLRIYTKNVPPFVTVKDSITGIEYNTLKLATEHLKLKMFVYIAEVAFQGSKNHTTGLYQNEGLRSVRNGSFDVAIGCFHPKHETLDDFDNSIVFYIDRVIWVVPKSKPKTILKVWIEAFSLTTIGTLWLLLGFVIIFVKIFYGFPAKTLTLWFVQIFLEVSVEKVTTHCNFRIVMLCSIFACFILTTLVKNVFLLTFFSIKYEKEIDSVQDIIDSKYHLRGPFFIYDLFKSIGSEKERMLLPRMTPKDAAKEMIEELAQKQDSITWYMRKPLMNDIPEKYMDPVTRRPLIHIGDPVVRLYYQFLFRRGYPAFNQINGVLLQLYDVGFFNFEDKMATWKYTMEISSSKQEFHTAKLTMNHLYLFFSLWLAGLTVACMVFIIEICVKRGLIKSNLFICSKLIKPEISAENVAVHRVFSEDNASQNRGHTV